MMSPNKTYHNVCTWTHRDSKLLCFSEILVFTAECFQLLQLVRWREVVYKLLQDIVRYHTVITLQDTLPHISISQVFQ